MAPPAQCNACGCAQPAGTQCEPPIITFWQNLGCSAQCSASGGPCQSLGCGDAKKYTAGAPKVFGGTCAPTGGGGVVPPVSWAETSRACGYSKKALEGGCSAGWACLPKPPSPFQPKTCVGTLGDVACPVAYPVKHSVYSGGVNDTRACAACQCGAPAGATCKVDVLAYGGNSCGGSSVVLTTPANCTDAKIYASTFQFGVPQITAGTCASSGGGPTGTATPTGPATLCCQAP